MSAYILTALLWLNASDAPHVLAIPFDTLAKCEAELSRYVAGWAADPGIYSASAMCAAGWFMERND